MQYVFVENENINENKSRVFVFAEKLARTYFVSISRNMFSVFIFEKNKTSRFFFFLARKHKGEFYFRVFPRELIFCYPRELIKMKKLNRFRFFPSASPRAK